MREELQQIYKKLKNYVDRKVEEIPVSAGGGSASPIIFTTADLVTATCNKTFEECLEDFRNYNNNVVLYVDAENPWMITMPHTSSYYNNTTLQYTVTMNGATITLDNRNGEISITLAE